MLVEINLLPKKESKNYTLAIVSGILLIVVLALGIFFYYTYNSYKEETAQLKEQITITKKIAGIQQSQNDASTRTDSVQLLKDYINWSEKERIKTVPVLVELIELLPERGYFMNFNYVNEGAIQLSVQFDTSKEAADYMNLLTTRNWISDVKLTSLSATKHPYEEEVKLTTVDGKVVDKEVLQENKEKYIPRYLGVFELTLNKEKALELASNTQASNQKGVDEVE